jgi:hypothetical protein
MKTLTLNKVGQNIFKYAVGVSAAAVLGGLAVASPAQALTPTGSLSFQDGTDDFFNEVNVGSGDTFDVKFNGGSILFVSEASGDFVPPFTGDNTIETIAPSTGEFLYVSGTAATGFTYELTNDLIFDFGNGAVVTWHSGTLFNGEFTATDNSVQFQWQQGQTLLPTVTGIGEDVTTIATAFQFSDTAASQNGGYTGSIDVVKTTPEPATLLGLGMVAAGVFVSRRKKSFKTIIG